MFVVDFQMCCKMLFQSVRKRKFKHRSKKYNTTTKEDENAYKLRGSIVDSKGKDQWCYHKEDKDNTDTQTKTASERSVSLLSSICPFPQFCLLEIGQEPAQTTIGRRAFGFLDPSGPCLCVDL